MAACGSAFEMGQHLRIPGIPGTVQCLDHGLGPPLWVDAYFYDAADGWAWQAQVGSEIEVEVLEP